MGSLYFLGYPLLYRIGIERQGSGYHLHHNYFKDPLLIGSIRYYIFLFWQT